jgi:NAD(P)-dependent dehydrogenase (short-subunit alcohol dehydrogenase family)
MYARHGIRCNLIKPGWTETTIASNITGPISEEGRDRIREFVNLTPYRLAVEDIATLALFLASDRARHINGAEIAADGGLTTASTASKAATPPPGRTSPPTVPNARYTGSMRLVASPTIRSTPGT